MAPATEIAYLPLKKGKWPDGDDSTTTKLHDELIEIVLSQPGCQRLYWSREHENPDNLRWFLDWNSVDDHKKFMDSPAYKPFLEKFGELLGGAPQLWHAEYRPHPPSALLDGKTTPATEVLHAYFPTDLSKEDATAFQERIAKLAGAIEKGAGEDYTGFVAGWVDEELDIPGKEEKGKVYSVLVGWKSVEAHNKFRETQIFKDNIHLLREAKHLKGVNMIHFHGKAGQK